MPLHSARPVSPLKLTSWASRLWWRFAALLALICSATLLAGTQLVENTLRQALDEAFTVPFVLATERAVQAAEQALVLGMPLSPDSPVADLLRREAQALAPALQRFTIESDAGVLLQHSEPSAPPGLAPTQISRPIRNDLGQSVGLARIDYDEGPLRQARQQLHQAVQRALWSALLAMVAVLALSCAVLLRPPARRQPWGLRGLLVGSAALALSAALAWVGWHAHATGQASIRPAQTAKGEALARSSAALVGRALAVGVPPQALVGLPEHLDILRRQSPEVSALTLLDADGRVLAGRPPPSSQPTVTAPVLRAEGHHAAQLLLAFDPGVLTRQLQGRLMDVAVLGAISLLLALEWVALGLGARGARALSLAEARQRRCANPEGARSHWRPSGAASVRPALFLFMLSEELTRPFLPTWARTLAPDMAWFSPDMLASAPLVLFLALVALLQWPLAAWSQRLGRRRGLVLGALLGALGLAGVAAWPSYGALLLARALGALGFALVFVSAQGAVIDGSSSADRAHSLGQFVRAILVAALCGPPLGGLVADRWGEPATLALAALVALLAALAARWHLPATHPIVRPGPGASPAAPIASKPSLARSDGLWPLLLGCALPAKLLLAAWCFYLLPMHLQAQGHGHAVIGRLQLVYPLAMVLLVPLAARLADRWQSRSAFVVAGGVLAGLSAWLAWPAAQTPLLLAWALLGLGLGQALSITPQSALVADRARQQGGASEAALLGLFRLTERGGSALGPALGAWLLPLIGFGPALALIGSLMVGGSLLHGLRAGPR